MATDLAEFLGAAIGFHLLFGIGLFPATLITGATTFAILWLQRFGFRTFEAVIIGFVGVISACYIAELWYAHPPLGTVAKHAVVPQFSGSESLLLAVGILGATVMPHVIYLHSALTQNRIVPAERGRGAAALPVHEDRRRDRDVDRRDHQHGDARRRGHGLLRKRTPERRLARDRASHARAAPRQRVERAVRARADRVRPLELDRRDARRPGRDAGLHPPPDPDLDPPHGDDASRIRRDRASASTRRGRSSSARSCSRSESRSRSSRSSCSRAAAA